MTADTRCPQCGSASVMFSKKRQLHVCEDCEHTFPPAEERVRRRIFISYGHDEHAGLAEKLRLDLLARGHEVWFDLERLRPGGDWEAYIDEGLQWLAGGSVPGRVLLLLTPRTRCADPMGTALTRSPGRSRDASPSSW